MTELDQLKFTEEHEWIDEEGETLTIGITDHAQNELGDIVFIELPQVGDEVEKGEELVVIESVKSVSNVASPISGEVVEVNEELEVAPESVNESPYEDGWLVKLAPAQGKDLEGTLTLEEYEDMVE